MSPSCSEPTPEPTQGAPLTTAIPDDQTPDDLTPDDEPRRWAITAARAADSKVGRDVVVLDVGEVLAVCGWFVIASAANDRQVKAICDEVELQVHAVGGPKPKRIEGLTDRTWVLMDYGDVVVHVFQQGEREFYDLDRLWADVPKVEWQEPAA